MATATKSLEEHEAAMKARGMRKITRWVPDVENPEFVKEYRRQIAVLTEKSEQEGSEFWEWIASVQCTDGWV